MQSRGKIDLLQRLTNHYVSGETAKTMSKLCEAAKSAMNDRNAIVHGVVVEKEGKLAMRSWVGKARLTGEPEYWPVERVFELAATLISITGQLDDLIEGFGGQTASELENPANNG